MGAEPCPFRDVVGWVFAELGVGDSLEDAVDALKAVLRDPDPCFGPLSPRQYLVALDAAEQVCSHGLHVDSVVLVRRMCCFVSYVLRECCGMNRSDTACCFSRAEASSFCCD